MERLGNDVRAELARHGAQSGMAEIVERWPAAVGEAIARRAWPARVARDGTLLANAADSVWAFELGQRAEEIAARLGVPAVRFTPGPLPQPDADVPPEAARRPPEPTPAEVEQARLAAVSIEDEELRESVQRAASLSLARARSDLSV